MSGKYAVAGGSDPGRVRTNNEDSWIIREASGGDAQSGLLALVADGMSGHAAGEIASALAIDIISNVFFSTPGDVPTVLQTAVSQANEAILKQAEDPDRRGMGTTVVGVHIDNDVAIVLNVGDSRAYLIEGGKTAQITRDHSFVAEQVRAGLLSEAEALIHPYRNVITRSLGHVVEVVPDLFQIDLQPGDRILLCSDGLSNMVSPEAIAEISSNGRLNSAVRGLIDLANDHGGLDNITAVLVGVRRSGKRRDVDTAPVPTVETTTT